MPVSGEGLQTVVEPAARDLAGDSSIPTPGPTLFHRRDWIGRSSAAEEVGRDEVTPRRGVDDELHVPVRDPRRRARSEAQSYACGDERGAREQRGDDRFTVCPLLSTGRAGRRLCLPGGVMGRWTVRAAAREEPGQPGVDARSRSAPSTSGSRFPCTADHPHLHVQDSRPTTSVPGRRALRLEAVGPGSARGRRDDVRGKGRASGRTPRPEAPPPSDGAPVDRTGHLPLQHDLERTSHPGIRTSG